MHQERFERTLKHQQTDVMLQAAPRSFTLIRALKSLDLNSDFFFHADKRKSVCGNFFPLLYNPVVKKMKRALKTFFRSGLS